MIRWYYVYIVVCRDRTFYTGVTNDLERRLAEHNYGLDPNCYTFTRRPVHLVFSSDFKEIDDAIRFEKQVKGRSAPNAMSAEIACQNVGKNEERFARSSVSTDSFQANNVRI